MVEDADGDALFIEADVRAHDVEAIVNRAVETYGRLGHAFNNAGIEGVQAPTAEYPEEARAKVADLIGARPEETYFTYLAIVKDETLVFRQGGGGSHWATGRVRFS